MVLGLEINIEEINGRIILRLIGRLDASSCSILQNKIDVLLQENHKNVFLDFSNIDYLSSAGLRVLLSSTKKFNEQNGRLGIFAISEEVMQIIKMTGFEKILNIYNKEKEALLEKPL